MAPPSTYASIPGGRQQLAHVEVYRRAKYVPRPDELPNIGRRPPSLSGDRDTYRISRSEATESGAVVYLLVRNDGQDEPFPVEAEKVLDFVSPRHLEEFENGSYFKRKATSERRKREKGVQKASQLKKRNKLQPSMRGKTARACGPFDPSPSPLLSSADESTSTSDKVGDTVNPPSAEATALQEASNVEDR
ncbi:MAG: hypothetical protein M1833_006382 [Piccolia ochrophora]|nr:MAG: hypothetical protein M1833_006382 [Piccolia ochrophora]